MAFNAASLCKKDPIYPATIALIISYYRLDGRELLWFCAYNCGSQSYCGSGSTCASSCQSAGFANGLCTNRYLSLTILYLVYILMLRYVSIVTCRVFVVTPMALEIHLAHRPIQQRLRGHILGMRHAKIWISFRIQPAKVRSRGIAQ